MFALALGAVIVSLFFLGRLVLILMGVLKDPVLRVSQRYAVGDDLYYPLPWLLLWFGLFLFAGGLLLTTVQVSIPIYFLGFLIMLLAYGAYERPQWAAQYPALLLSYPRWYYNLRDRTTREERRRIAYMWLWLPRGLRLYYNSHDPAFNQWADLIILSTTMQTVDDGVEKDTSLGGFYSM